MSERPGPEHYQHAKVQNVDWLRSRPEVLRGHCIGSILKYLDRLGRKEQDEDEEHDLVKAHHWLVWLIQQEVGIKGLEAARAQLNHEIPVSLESFEGVTVTLTVAPRTEPPQDDS